MEALECVYCGVISSILMNIHVILPYHLFVKFPSLRRHKVNSLISIIKELFVLYIMLVREHDYTLLFRLVELISLVNITEIKVACLLKKYNDDMQ